MIEEESEKLICSLFKINTTIEKIKIDITKEKSQNIISRDVYNSIILESLDIICEQSKKINNCLFTNITLPQSASDKINTLEDRFNNEINSILLELKENECKICNELGRANILENLEFISTDLLKELEVHIKSITGILSEMANMMTKMFKDPSVNQCNIYLVCKFRFIQILSFRVISELKII